MSFYLDVEVKVKLWNEMNKNCEVVSGSETCVEGWTFYPDLNKLSKITRIFYLFVTIGKTQLPFQNFVLQFYQKKMNAM